MSGESNRSVNEGEKEEHTWSEQIEIAASELVDKTKELIEEGNVRRLIIRNQERRRSAPRGAAYGGGGGGRCGHVARAGARYYSSDGGVAHPREGRDHSYQGWQPRVA